MKVARKLLLAGGSSLALAGGILALPLAPTAGATPHTLESMTKPLDNYVLKDESSASFDVKTEVDPGDHTLWATVTNKTDQAVVPNITFNGEQPLYTSDSPLEPGEDRKYSYDFTGNNFGITVEVSAEGAETATSTATVDIQEPVSFTATETNENVIVGSLRNNSTLVPQTVYTKAYDDQMKVEHLEPGEERTIAIPHNATEEQKSAGITIATAAGYESSYSVKLGLVPELPISISH